MHHLKIRKRETLIAISASVKMYLSVWKYIYPFHAWALSVTKYS